MLYCEAETEEITMEAVRQRSKTYDLVYVSIFVVLIAICSWISIPFTVPVTLQTFGVFIAVGLLGGKRGTLAVLVYILMGAIGDPCIFRIYRRDRHSGRNYRRIYRRLSLFRSYYVGNGKAFWEKYPGAGRFHGPGIACLLAVGTLWFMAVYAASSGAVGILTVLGWCVFPFIIPDIAQIVLALILTKRLSGVIKR